MVNFTASCIQINSGNDLKANIDKISELIKEASQKANFITLPENAFFMAENKEELFENSFAMENHPIISKMQRLCEQLNINLLIGGMAIKAQAASKLANRSILLSNDGEIRAYYDKIHMFDVNIPNGESHTESATYEAGKNLVLTELLSTKLGMSICYDLRFPQQYHEMAQQGAEIFTIPAAFTYETGKAHWEILLRARAIECGAFVIAPALCGKHPAGKRTWGHSMIINPWGEILAQAKDAESIIYAGINLAEVEKARKAIPSLNNACENSYKTL